MFKLTIKVHKDKFTFRFCHNGDTIFTQTLDRLDKSKIGYYDEEIKSYITKNMTVN